jgi:hypothetical protein
MGTICILHQRRRQKASAAKVFWDAERFILAELEEPGQSIYQSMLLDMSAKAPSCIAR